VCVCVCVCVWGKEIYHESLSNTYYFFYPRRDATRSQCSSSLIFEIRRYRIIDSLTEANDFAHQFSRCSGFLKGRCPDPLCDGIGILGKLIGSSPRLLDESEILAIRMEQGSVVRSPTIFTFCSTV